MPIGSGGLDRRCQSRSSNLGQVVQDLSRAVDNVVAYVRTLKK